MTDTMRFKGNYGDSGRPVLTVTTVNSGGRIVNSIATIMLDDLETWVEIFLHEQRNKFGSAGLKDATQLPDFVRWLRKKKEDVQ